MIRQSIPLFLLLSLGAPAFAASSGTVATELQQSDQARGTVVDKNGEAVIGATVKVKGQKVGGTITDLDGHFALRGLRSGQTLVVSYVGYQTQEVRYTGGEPRITLQEDSKVLEDLVVVGYGTMRKKDLTGSVVQIRPDRLANEAPKTV